MIKLYIFESVADALAFEHPAPATETAERPARHYTRRKKAKEAFRARILRKAKSAKRSSDAAYTPEQVIELAKRVAAREISTKDAAKELGVSLAVWYTAKSRFAKGIKKAEAGERSDQPAQRCFSCSSEEHNTKDCPDLDDTIAGLRAKKLNSLSIASRLRLSLQVVNAHWAKDEPIEPGEEEEE